MIVVLDDEPLILESGRELLARKFDVRVFADPLVALAHLAEHAGGVDVVLTDVRMPGLDGLSLLEQVRAAHPGVEVIVQTGHGTIATAVRAIQLGAYDFFCKPIEDLDAAVRRIEAAVERRRLRALNARLTQRLEAFREGTDLVGQSRGMQRVRQLIDQIAGTSAIVLIRGESGTGKELVARALHAGGARSGKPFVAVNCAAVAESLIDSELFGHEKGAFTGAATAHKGLFEAADGGVLFLDEIGDVPLATQVRLLRALQEGEIRAVGATKSRKIDVRVIAATNVDLERAMREGRFREDLYYRISTFVVDLPPLRERRGDVPLVAQHLLEKLAKRTGKDVRGFTDAAMSALAAHAWPGNVRELANAVEYAATLCAGPLIEVTDLPSALAVGVSSRARPTSPSITGEHALAPYVQARTELLDDFERRYLEQLLALSEGNLSEASRRSGIDRSNLRRLLRRHALFADRFRHAG